MRNLNESATLFGIGFNSASMYGELEKIEQKQDFNYNLFSYIGKEFIGWGEYAFSLKKGDITEKLLGEDREKYIICMKLLTDNLGKEEYHKRRNNFFRVKSTIESIINKEETFREDVENAKLFFKELSDKVLSEQEKISKNSSYIFL